MIFGKKKCKNCGEKVDREWNFCPACGVSLKKVDLNEEFNKELRRVSKIVGFGKIIGLPSMDIKQDEDGSMIIKVNIGMVPKIVEKPQKDKIELKKPIRVPESIEEPETKIEKKGNKQVITIKLPGVKYEDIEIKRLENSIEIKAFVDKKAYFKLLPIPSTATINKSFENEILKIEVTR